MEPQPTHTRPRVVVVERDPGVRALLARLLGHWGIEARVVSASDAGVRAVREHGPALVISDFRPAEGERTVHDLLGVEPGPSPPRFLCTLPTSDPLPEGVTVVERPFDPDTLRDLIHRLVAD